MAKSLLVRFEDLPERVEMSGDSNPFEDDVSEEDGLIAKQVLLDFASESDKTDSQDLQLQFYAEMDKERNLIEQIIIRPHQGIQNDHDRAKYYYALLEAIKDTKPDEMGFTDDNKLEFSLWWD